MKKATFIWLSLEGLCLVFLFIWIFACVFSPSVAVVIGYDFITWLKHIASDKLGQRLHPRTIRNVVEVTPRRFFILYIMKLFWRTNLHRAPHRMHVCISRVGMKNMLALLTNAIQSWCCCHDGLGFLWNRCTIHLKKSCALVGQILTLKNLLMSMWKRCDLSRASSYIQVLVRCGASLIFWSFWCTSDKMIAYLPSARRSTKCLYIECTYAKFG